MPVRVLLLDSHEALYAAMTDSFDATEFQFRCANSTSAESIAKELAEETDVVLLDIKVPNGHGIEALQLIREIQPHVPVLIYTLQDRPDVVDRCRLLGAKGYLIKGVSRHCLTSAIRDACDGQGPWYTIDQGTPHDDADVCASTSQGGS